MVIGNDENVKSTIRSSDKISLSKNPRTYLAIDLKSFYASVECQERALDPLKTNLVVADVSRTEKTICLAVSPSLKAYGIPGRARLFEVVQKVREINAARRAKAPNHVFTGKSSNSDELASNPSLELDYIAATPRMSFYMKYSTLIYEIYLRFIAPEDIHVYSIDEVMIDASAYLNTYGITARELTRRMIREVYRETGITAAAGIGDNLYLAKVAMDIMAKHVEPDEDGVRIAELDEKSYRKNLWTHRPLTDFWRIGKGYASKLQESGLFTMGDVARCSLENEDLLYRLFGVNAELLIDHAWGWEPCTMEMIKTYKPENNSVSSGQVLPCPYVSEKARIVVREMADASALDLVARGLVTDQVVLTVCYEAYQNVQNGHEMTKDWYGRRTPRHAHGSHNLARATSSGRKIVEAALEIYDRTVDPSLLIRRIYFGLNHLRAEDQIEEESCEQMSLFTDYEALQKEKAKDEASLEKERRMQEAILSIKKKYGGNAILKGTSFRDGATGKERNNQIGGHKS